MARQSYPQGQGSPLLIEIDLQNGIIRQDPPLNLMRNGAQVGLRRSSNCLWQPRHGDITAVTGAIGRRGIAFGAIPAPISTYNGVFSGSLVSRLVTYAPFAGYRQRNLVAGRSAAGNFAIWRVDTNGLHEQTLLLGTSTFATDQSGLPGSHLYWRQANLNVLARNLDGSPGNDHAEEANSANGLMFFCHPDVNRIYYADNNGSTDTDAATTNVAGPNGDMSKWYIKSYTDTNTDTDKSRWMDVGSLTPPAGASALALHLDRLWMAKPSEPFGTTTLEGRSTTVYFTAPNNWRLIQSTNFLIIEDQVRAMASPANGGIGVGGQSQLVFFGINSVNVLDGDPTLGNTFYRTLANNIGTVCSKSVVETPYGIVFVGTDQQVYLIPPGAQRLLPVGTPIIEVLNYYMANQVLSTQPPVQLLWLSPYVYMIVGTLNRVYLLDFSNPENPKWWGEFTNTYTNPVISQVVPHPLDSINAKSVYFFTHNPEGASDITTRCYLDMTIEPNLVGRASILRTGLVNVPGHRVQLDAVHIYQVGPAASHPLTIKARTVEGQEYIAVEYGHQHPTAVVSGTTDNNEEYPQLRTFKFAKGVTSDAVTIIITGGTATADDTYELYIHKAYAAVRIQPFTWS